MKWKIPYIGFNRQFENLKEGYIREFKKECFIKLNNLKLDKTTLNACLLEAQDLFSKIQN